MAESDQVTAIRVKVRMDYKGQKQPGRFLFGSKNMDRVAEELRDQQVALLRNVPLQGIVVENVDANLEVYTVWDDLQGANVAYAPVLLTLYADSIEDLLRFIIREGFCKVEILEPASMELTRYSLERLLFKVGEEVKRCLERSERRKN